MTPKEKAKELVQVYFKEVSDANPLEDILVSAKRCALICVEEILRNEVNTTMHPNDIVMDYWKKVKQEINKL
jgi:hypothetical protein